MILLNVNTANAILKGRHRITPSGIFVEGISGTEEWVAGGRSSTLE